MVFMTLKTSLKWSSISLVGIVSLTYFNNRYCESLVMGGFPRYIDNFVFMTYQYWGGPKILKDFWGRPIMVEAYYCRTKAYQQAVRDMKTNHEAATQKINKEEEPIVMPGLSIADFLKKDLPLKIVTYCFKEDYMDKVRQNFHDFCYLALKLRLTFRKDQLSWSEKVKVENDLKAFSSSWPSKEALKGVQLCAFTREADESITFDFPDNPEIPGFNIKNKIMADWWFGKKMDFKPRLNGQELIFT